MNHSIDLAIRIAHERQAREREIRALRALRALSASAERASIRQRIGETLIRFGERLASPDPAWSR